MVPAVIIGVISIFTTLPKWLKYPAWTILGAMVLNGPYQKLAEKWGLDKKIKEALGQNDYTPNQAGNNPNTEPGIIEEWWARVSGVDAQFKYGYAKIRNEGNMNFGVQFINFI